MAEALGDASCRCGRAWRHRKRRRRAREQGDIPVVVDADSVFIRLNQWLRKGSRKFSHAQLKPALFADTGRGLMATRAIHSGEVLVSIPEEMLITTSKVIEDSILLAALQKSGIKFRAMDLLALFLLYHRFLGEKSQWKSYLESLPSEYCVPAYCSQEETDTFPEMFKGLKLNQDEDVSQCYSSIQIAASASEYLQSLFCSLCIEQVRWSWFTVNTRAVYCKNQKPPRLVLGDDTCALAPYLDLLNHTHTHKWRQTSTLLTAAMRYLPKSPTTSMNRFS
ncbi:SET domain-containing protein 4 [Chionoecetes opilio]|uniref:SET domain-containing protein 4 n=1 Tax=Chionoecetes opilio TaxID=41210 RepID=A0A8J5D2D6_CHIOP|nr:SET domain-containing protein 4 [Chionoecetes opilio]